jgi:hypothetical protein
MNKTLIVTLAVALAALVACPPLAEAASSSPPEASSPAPALLLCTGLPCDLINEVTCHTLHRICLA